MKYTIIADEYTADPVVSVADLKSHLNILHDNDNYKLLALSLAAEDYFERETRRFLLTKSVVGFFADFNSIKIEHRPNVVVDYIEYLNSDGDTDTILIDPDMIDDKGLDTVVTVESAPTLGNYPNALTVYYTVGYGTAADVPALVKLAIKGLVTHWYMQPSPVVTGTIAAELPLHVQSIMNQFRIVEV